MRKITLSFATAALVIGLGSASASAMPMDNLARTNVGAKADQVRLVCDQWGRCWYRRNYYDYGDGYPGYGYVYPGFGYGAYYGGGRRFHGGWRGGGHHRH